MSEPATLQLRQLTLEGLRTLVEWASLEGWNPGLHDAEIFWATDPEGYYGFYRDDELIAGGAIVSYNGEFGFMGLFLVRPDMRGQGIGSRLWQRRRDMLLSRLQKGASIGMDGVVAMQAFYNKGGFDIAFRDERYELIGSPQQLSAHVSKITSSDLEQIADYDTRCFGFARPRFLQPWLAQQDACTFKYTDSEGLRGFVVARKARSGYKVGPLFADKAEVAEALYRACLDAVGESALYLDIPVSNPEAVALVQRCGASYVFECARMYYGKAPEVDISRIFGVTTFELG